MTDHEKLNQIAHLAAGSKVQRLLHQPFRYIKGISYRRLIYPFTKKGKLVQTHTFFNQPMEITLPSGMDLYLLGAKTHDSEIRLSRFLLNHLNKGDIFVDIGAHFGYYSLLAAYMVGNEGKTIAIEASPSTFELLKKNTRSHPSIQTHHKAATANKQPISFYEFPILYSEYNTANPSIYQEEAWFKQNPPQKVEVQGICVDDLTVVVDHNATVKIDVEGGEPLVIEGMKAFLEAGKGMVIMEYLVAPNLYKGSTSAQRATDALAIRGYLPHIIQKDGYLQSISLKGIEDYLRAMKLNSDNLVFKKE